MFSSESNATGNYIWLWKAKNMKSFFAILLFMAVLKRGPWREEGTSC